MGSRSSRSPSQLRRDEDRVVRKCLLQNLETILSELETVQSDLLQDLENDMYDLLENLELSEVEEGLIGEILSKL